MEEKIPRFLVKVRFVEVKVRELRVWAQDELDAEDTAIGIVEDWDNAAEVEEARVLDQLD